MLKKKDYMQMIYGKKNKSLIVYKKRRYLKKENELKIQCAEYMNYQYPKILWDMKWDHINFSNVTKKENGEIKYIPRWNQIKTIKRISCNNFSMPDFFLACNGGKRINKHNTLGFIFSGCYIEFKKDKNEIYNIKGMYRKNKHLRDQIEAMMIIWSEGFYCSFCWSFKMFKYIVDRYVHRKFLEFNIHSLLDDFELQGF
ncbi:MAG: hypothetical protein ACFFG0_04460 [Candidatus Thorarchaeota archaeon]